MAAAEKVTIKLVADRSYKNSFCQVLRAALNVFLLQKDCKHFNEITNTCEGPSALIHLFGENKTVGRGLGRLRDGTQNRAVARLTRNFCRKLDF